MVNRSAQIETQAGLTNTGVRTSLSDDVTSSRLKADF